MTNHIKNALPIVARAIGEKLDVNVVFDDGPARMDFDNIYLPNGDMDDPEFETLAYGYTAHESAHFKYSDYEVLVESTKSPLRKSLTNILEDIRIEKAIGIVYPGLRTFLDNLNKLMIKKGLFGTTSAFDSPVSIVTSYVLYCGYYESVKLEEFFPLFQSAQDALLAHFSHTQCADLQTIINKIHSAQSNRDALDVADEIIAAQRAALAANTDGKGFGPQSPRDIDDIYGESAIAFTAQLPATEMNLCNIHFHKNAEHKGGEFTEYAGNGDGHGYSSGYKYSGAALSEAELAETAEEIGASDHGSVHSGDTIEVHYVHTTANVKPGPTLGACLSDSIGNPQLRVETQVYVLVNDNSAQDFEYLTEYAKKSGYYQAVNIPANTGKPIQYAGSTTGPSYNEQGSPLQVTWSVRPQVTKVNISSVAEWLTENDFEEDHLMSKKQLYGI